MLKKVLQKAHRKRPKKKPKKADNESSDSDFEIIEEKSSPKASPKPSDESPNNQKSDRSRESTPKSENVICISDSPLSSETDVSILFIFQYVNLLRTPTKGTILARFWKKSLWVLGPLRPNTDVNEWCK